MSIQVDHAEIKTGQLMTMLIAIVAFVTKEPFWLMALGLFFLVTALTYGIICLGLNVQWGQTGLFNVGVAGFVAIGAYASALLTTPDEQFLLEQRKDGAQVRTLNDDKPVR